MAPLFRTAALVVAAALVPLAQAAEPAKVEMQSMDTDRDNLVSKQEFMAAIEKLWDAQAAQAKRADGKMNEKDLRALEKVLGRMLGAGAR